MTVASIFGSRYARRSYHLVSSVVTMMHGGLLLLGLSVDAILHISSVKLVAKVKVVICWHEPMRSSCNRRGIHPIDDACSKVRIVVPGRRWVMRMMFTVTFYGCSLFSRVCASSLQQPG
jgi:hypothetical protein